MKINNLIKGSFLERPNRFTIIFKAEHASRQAENDHRVEQHAAHLKDPGRLKELLHPGVNLLLRPVPPNPKRKTQFDVIAVFKDDMWVLINSGFHSDLAADLISSGLIDEFKDYHVQKREYSFGRSRLDFLLSPEGTSKDPMLVEVKGCTLVEQGHAWFPDAPTSRGKRHLEELIAGKKQGFDSAVIFLILKEDADIFSPNHVTDPDFARTLHYASAGGVNIIPYVFETTFKKGSLVINPFKRVKLKFNTF